MISTQFYYLPALISSAWQRTTRVVGIKGLVTGQCLPTVSALTQYQGLRYRTSWRVSPSIPRLCFGRDCTFLLIGPLQTLLLVSFHLALHLTPLHFNLVDFLLQLRTFFLSVLSCLCISAESPNHDHHLVTDRSF